MNIPRFALPAVLVLMLASAVGTMLVLARVAITFKTKFLFLPGNLFLAWLPLIFAFACYQLHRNGDSGRLKFAAVAFLWLIFLPNAPYILTDFIHLKPRPEFPIWGDMMLIALFAGIGLVLGLLSLYCMQQIVSDRFGRASSWGFVAVTLLLCGLGMYIGRFLRWHSWHLFFNPFALAADLWEHFGNPRANPKPLAVTMLFSTLCSLAYLSLHALTHLRFSEADPRSVQQT